MPTVVRSSSSSHSYRHGRGALEQRFEFEGDAVDAAAIADVLMTAPLVGEHSVFGTRPGLEGDRNDQSRSLRGFSPAPGFRFDVDVSRRDGVFIVHFSEPDRRVPYLQGDLLWTVSTYGGAAVLDEQINTQQALETVTEPLGGARRSVRRWLFFQMGHRQVMLRATRNIAALLDNRGATGAG